MPGWRILVVEDQYLLQAPVDLSALLRALYDVVRGRPGEATSRCRRS